MLLFNWSIILIKNLLANWNKLGDLLKSSWGLHEIDLMIESQNLAKETLTEALGCSPK